MHTTPPRGLSPSQIALMTDAEITERLMTDDAGVTRLLEAVLWEEEDAERWDGMS